MLIAEALVICPQVLKDVMFETKRTVITVHVEKEWIEGALHIIPIASFVAVGLLCVNTNIATHLIVALYTLYTLVTIQICSVYFECDLHIGTSICNI